ncbi:hypothetical protein [Thermogymnomonas acidicola]|uniref:phospholipase D-like domain-containing protein n=1 Tax=Thermogymnomonas acidicola TaxID=399579 RepID=UPI001396842D|nr:phospholipase D-like domain-containing protein [Thermogymnomonas acidicola]
MLSSELMQNEDDIGYFQLLKEAVDYFSGNKVEVKIVNGRFFHGKAYLGASPSFSDIRSGFASVGSSNFTGGGLAGNKELNMLTTDREVVEELSEWFMEQWNDGNSRNFKDKFLELLKNYVTTHSPPYEVVAKALYEVYSPPQLSQMGREDYLKSLYPHQVLSYTRARSILQDYGGVVIADSTGLGENEGGHKPCHGCGEVREEPASHSPPKTALDTTWHDEMNKTHFHMDSINTELISSNPPDTALRDYQDRDFIIIDEAHDFRTPSSNRYKALQEFMASGKREVVLLTATPPLTTA